MRDQKVLGLPLVITFLALGIWLFGSCTERQFSDNEGADVAARSNRQAPDLGPDGFRDGVWLTFVGSNVFDSRKSLAAALKQIRDAGFDTVYPIVWNKGCTTYPSATMAKLTGEAICPAFSGRDPLKEILEENERLGLHLAVIPWFEYGLKVVFGPPADFNRPSVDNLSRRYDLAFKARELGLLLKRQDGSDAWYDWEPNKKTGSRHFFGFLNPAAPRVVEMITSLAREITQGYQVDGFQIDDHFSIHHEFGYNSEIYPLFDAFLSRKGLTRFSLSAQGLSPAEAAEQQRHWKSFRTDLVADLATTLASQFPKRPGFVYQVSPAGDIGFSMNLWLQNWRRLTQDGIVQEFIIQAYREDVPSFVNLIRQSSVSVSANRTVPQVGLFAGYKGQKLRETQLLVDQIRAARQRSFGAVRKPGMGVSVFFYDTLFNGDPARVAAIRAALQGP